MATFGTSTLAPDGTTVIEPDERVPLIVVGVLSMLGGALGGLLLYWRLDGDVKVQAGFWTAMLTVAALSALPLVATTTHIARLLKNPTPGATSYTALAPIFMLAAAAATLVAVVVCLYQIAMTSGASDPSDLVLACATIIIGTSAGAAVYGVAAAILDKLDDPTPPPPPPSPPAS
jgi:hypothetical protein